MEEVKVTDEEKAVSAANEVPSADTVENADAAASEAKTEDVLPQTDTDLSQKTESDTSPREQTQPKKSKKKKRSAASYAAELFVKIAVTAAVVWLLCTYVISIHINHSNSSYPMIKDGDLCISYRLGELRDGDEVSYKHDNKVCFGRIAAQSGDTVEIKNGYVSVDGYGVLEDVVYETTTDGALIEFPYTIPDNGVFVLNDFREDVNDSRSFGALDRSEIEGKVVFVIRRRGI